MSVRRAVPGRDPGAGVHARVGEEPHEDERVLPEDRGRADPVDLEMIVAIRDQEE